MANNTCDCNAKGNGLTDLEVMELVLQAAALAAEAITGIRARQVSEVLVSVPDLAVKLVDALAKSKETLSYDDFMEAASALYHLMVKLGELSLDIAKNESIWGRIDFLQDTYFKLKDTIGDPNSPLNRAIDQYLEGKKEQLNITGDENANQIEGGVLSDVLNGMGGDDTINGNCGNDILIGGSGNDALNGGGCDDYLDGGSGSDNISGDDGNDILQGGMNDNVSDHLSGGWGFDTYIAGSNDAVSDLDGKGVVYFKNIDLSGTKHKVKGKDYYEDGSFYYLKNGGTLVVSSKSGGSMTIVDWSNKELGITLGDSIEVSITKEASALERDSGRPELYFTVTLSRALEDGESLKVSVSSTDEGYVIFESGERSKRVTHSWDGDTKDEASIDHTATLSLTGEYTGPYKDLEVVILNSGKAIVYDDDEEQRHDPLALDMDMDGFISTTALETSGTYFDITGDGLKERVGWISGADALLSYDKNDNGEIDGINEVFGSLSGCELEDRLMKFHDERMVA